MTYRRKAGDLALVAHDEDCCRPNIGKLVRVAGPVGFNDRLRKDCWLIEPVRPERWHCVNVSGQPYQRVVTFASQVEHPDAWLLPIDPAIFPFHETAGRQAAGGGVKGLAVKTAPPPTPKPAPAPAPDGVAPWAKELLQAHGIPMAPRDHWIYAEGASATFLSRQGAGSRRARSKS